MLAKLLSRLKSRKRLPALVGLRTGRERVSDAARRLVGRPRMDPNYDIARLAELVRTRVLGNA